MSARDIAFTLFKLANKSGSLSLLMSRLVLGSFFWQLSNEQAGAQGLWASIVGAFIAIGFCSRLVSILACFLVGFVKGGFVLLPLLLLFSFGSGFFSIDKLIRRKWFSDFDLRLIKISEELLKKRPVQNID